MSHFFCFLGIMLLCLSCSKPLNDSPNSPPAPNGFVWIAPGTFTMGSGHNQTGHAADESERLVTLDGFYMAKYELSQSEWDTLMPSNPSHHKGGDYPLDYINWYRAIAFCNLLSLSQGLEPCYNYNAMGYDPKLWPLHWETNPDQLPIVCNWQANGYRLPSEAEWEYACRASSTSPFWTGDSISGQQANIDNRLINDSTCPRGKYPANAWGLYDMVGNVAEWCWDWYQPDWPRGALLNPHGPQSGNARVIRGGSFGYQSILASLRSAARNLVPPSMQMCNMGFRLVRSNL